MADVVWLVKRLKAMSIPEVEWRVSQKVLQKNVEGKYKSHKVAVTETLFNKKLQNVHLNEEKMHINWDNNNFSLCTTIPLLGGYDYEK